MVDITKLPEDLEDENCNGIVCLPGESTGIDGDLKEPRLISIGLL